MVFADPSVICEDPLVLCLGERSICSEYLDGPTIHDNSEIYILVGRASPAEPIMAFSEASVRALTCRRSAMKIR